MITAQNKEHYLTAYRRVNDRRLTATPASPAWLEMLRRQGIASFAAQGFPTLKDEDWKYTNVEPVAAQAFAQANGEASSIIAAEVLSRSLIDLDASRLVFVNGIYSQELSNAAQLPAGLKLSRLAAFVSQDEASIENQLGHHASSARQPFVALNDAFLDDGAVVSVAPGCRLDSPVYVLFVSVAGERPVVSHPRLLILLGAGSEAKIVESYLGINGQSYLCNAVTELVGGADAIVDHYRLQQESENGNHVGTLAATLARGCQFTSHAVTLGGALVRNHVHVALNGAGAQCVLNGLYLADGKQHVDNFTEIEHCQPRASSLELYKGIISGSAHGVFNGKIVVHKDAQKSDARQTNKNLLLSPNAVVNTKPQLEIYADDVKCSHGSTIGQLDSDALFYLRSRGLGLLEARNLLTFAFAADVVQRIKIDPLRQRLSDYLVAKLAGGGAMRSMP